VVGGSGSVVFVFNVLVRFVACFRFCVYVLGFVAVVTVWVGLLMVRWSRFW
jgi:hypothetical protein